MTTGSMRPSVCEGDVLLVDQRARPPWKPGDLLLLPPGPGRAEKLVHRVLRIEEQGGRRVVITRGDANGFEDPPTAERDVLGRVAAVGRDDGGACARRGARAALARLLAPAFSSLTASGAWARLSSRTARRLGALRSRAARRALLAAWVALEQLRRAALRESMVGVVARAGAARA